MPVTTNAQIKRDAARRLLDIMFCHLLVCGWILFAQIRLKILTPVFGFFLIHLTILCMAERSWQLQSKTMRIWPPVVQLVFCVSRVVFGAVVLALTLAWAGVVVGLVGV